MPSLNNGLKGFYIDGKAVRKASLDGKVFFEKHNYELNVVADKNIISAYDGESATLTVTVLDFNEPVEGEKVIFSNDDVTEETEVNASGVYDFGEYFEVDISQLTSGDIVLIGNEVNGIKLTGGSNVVGVNILKKGVSNVYSVSHSNPIIFKEDSISFEALSGQVTSVCPDNIGDWTVNGSVIITSHFYKTGVTDSNGECSASYVGKGAGDLNIKVEVPNCSIVSEIYVEDCIIYDSLTSASGKWTIPSGVTSVYSDDGWKISASSYKQVKLTEKLTSDCSVEFTLMDYSTPSGNNPPVIIYQYTNGETTPNQLIITNSYASTLKVLGDTLSRSLVKGAVYKIEYTDSTMKVYENDTLLASATNNVGFPTRFEVHMGANSRYAVYKDLKVKPL